jgi:hypothetical protein
MKIDKIGEERPLPKVVGVAGGVLEIVDTLNETPSWMKTRVMNQWNWTTLVSFALQLSNSHFAIC